VAPAPGGAAGRSCRRRAQRTSRSARAREVRATRPVPIETRSAAQIPTIIHTANPRAAGSGYDDEACIRVIDPVAGLQLTELPPPTVPLVSLIRLGNVRSIRVEVSPARSAGLPDRSTAPLKVTVSPLRRKPIVHGRAPSIPYARARVPNSSKRSC